MPHHYDAIIIGAGHNGLTCGCYLARAGLKVLVLEQYHSVGGVTVTEEETLPGFWSDIHASGYQLCRSGSRPGPGVSMAPGRNAAQVIFGDLGLDFASAMSGSGPCTSNFAREKLSPA
jgi:phytoene dehydrogenase-like protein